MKYNDWRKLVPERLDKQQWLRNIEENSGTAGVRRQK
jgi:hypothetical protein